MLGATKAVRAVVAVLFVGVASLTVSLAAMSASTGGASVPGLNRELLVVRSGSMSPTFNAGDAVIVRHSGSRPSTALDPGTIVTFRSPANDGLLVTHRIVSVRTFGHAGPAYETKGDANPLPDETILTRDRLIGVVVGHVPRGGYALYALQRPQLLVAVIVAVLLAQAAVMSARRAIPLTERGNNERHP